MDDSMEKHEREYEKTKSAAWQDRGRSYKVVRREGRSKHRSEAEDVILDYSSAWPTLIRELIILHPI